MKNLIPNSTILLGIILSIICLLTVSPQGWATPKLYPSSGTGFAVTDDIVATAYHVIKGVVGPIIVITQNEPHVAQVIGIDTEHDIALLKVPGGKLQHLPLRPAVSGEVIISQGFAGTPLTLKHDMGRLEVGNKELTKGHTVTLLTNICSGMSGGPVVAQSDDAVVGLVNAQVTDENGKPGKWQVGAAIDECTSWGEGTDAKFIIDLMYLNHIPVNQNSSSETSLALIMLNSTEP